MAAPLHPSDEEGYKQTLARWASALLCIVLAHGAFIYAALNWPEPAVAPGEPPPAVMIELAPLPVAPDAEPQEVAVGPQMVMSEAVTPSDSAEKPDEAEPETPPEPLIEEIKPEVATEIETPPLPEVPSAEAVLAQATPPPPPPEKKPREDKRKAEKVKKKVKRKKPRERAAPNAPTTAAPQAANAPRARINAAPSAGAFSSASPATWRSAVMAHLNRRKRFPPGGSRGTSTVAFTIDRSGRVLSARLVRSSGDATLDHEAVALAHRASPVPAPPPNVGNGRSVLLAVPIRFGN
ncbi:MAG: TonB family protein [Rhizobiales bacterium]|nr:TonB family protein [Hyphomicrobiales bacterium]